MNICIECSRHTSNPKFCNRSCSAKYNNRDKPKRVRAAEYSSECEFCGGPRNSSRVGTYCTRECYFAARNAERVQTWLTTGEVLDCNLREGSAVRTFLYKDQNDQCALCSQGREWQGKPLNFILDHIDGNSSDSSRENVRLVCPNCDFQLPTSKGRNRGNGRHARRERYAKGLSN